ncbi:hypothetical protein KIN20_024498 [Parelaphostrongylus tenuis]|uniref:Calcineurin-like phosphoesterase domain-containing protein n=1 Tax=Parelaphostrongylus tenuis TaxID=148309 RepID=A0AAD5QW09_PARTN|nr:hypothetical protein KIN20_024498 [Parelaphostrongylus tenuis]
MTSFVLRFLFCLLCRSFSFLFYFFFLGSEPHILAQISLVGLATYLHVLVFLIIAEFIHIIGAVSLKCGFFTSVSRRITGNRHVFIFVSLFCALLFILGGIFTAFSDPVYTYISVPLKKLRNDELHTIVRLTNDLNPDIIAISGDLADGFVKHFGKAASPLCFLSAKHGVYFATGNHEYMHGNVEEWFSFLETCNITVLHNSQRRFTLKNGDNICVAGADDLYAAKAHFPGHAMDVKKAVDGCKVDDVIIMLAHQPNAAGIMLKDAGVNKKLDIILSGHTHGGQMYLFVPIIYMVNAFARGLYYYAATGTYVYVSAGVNYFGPPIKMFGACEIIDITLKPAI